MAVNHRHRPWIADDLIQLRDHAHLDTSRLASLLGRSKKAVERRAADLGIKIGRGRERQPANPGALRRWVETVALAHPTDECLIWPFGLDSKGYGSMTWEGRKVGAHRQVCELAHGTPPSPKHDAAHSCGNGARGCVNYRHLRWATHAENIADKVLHGTAQIGSRNPNAKLTEAQVRDIYLSAGAESQRATAERLATTPSAVSKIQRGQSWTHITRALP